MKENIKRLFRRPAVRVVSVVLAAVMMCGFVASLLPEPLVAEACEHTHVRKARDSVEHNDYRVYYWKCIECGEEFAETNKLDCFSASRPTFSVADGTITYNGAWRIGQFASDPRFFKTFDTLGGNDAQGNPNWAYLGGGNLWEAGHDAAYRFSVWPAPSFGARGTGTRAAACYTAPRAGVIRISFDRYYCADKVLPTFEVWHNGEKLESCSGYVLGKDIKSYEQANELFADVRIQVAAGDKIYFAFTVKLESGDSSVLAAALDPRVEYVDHLPRIFTEVK